MMKARLAVRQHGTQASEHLFGGFVGEGHGNQTARRHLTGLQQPGNAGGEHPGLARTCAGQYQRVLRRQTHRGLLLWVEAL